MHTTETLTVTCIEHLDKDEDMYDISVEDDHSYLLGNGIMSHNSVLVSQIALHQARQGQKVALVSLEMNRRECMRRMLSNLTAIPLSQINRIHDMDAVNKRLLVDAYKDYNSRVHKNGGRLTLFNPDEDVSIEDILTFLRPRGYDNIFIDYMGLLKGMDGEDQWRKLGSAARMGKRYTAGDQSVVTLLAQLSEEGLLRYSRTMQEHASLMWSFTRSKQEASDILTVKQPKARNLKAFDFYLQCQYHIMRLVDIDMSKIQTLGKQKNIHGPNAKGPITISGTVKEPQVEYQL